jgi:HAE1 family hydrophobic/amphiphilic exporter-1
MNLAEISVKRPVFVTCIAFCVVVMGLMSIKRLGVDLFPDVTFPVVAVYTTYPGAGPEEVENLVSRILEEKMSTVSGMKTLSSINKEGISIIIAEFNLETDIKDAEVQIRSRIALAKPELPKDLDEPVVLRMDPSNQPILILAVSSKLPDGQLFDLANERIKPQIEQVSQVGLVEVLGGRKREIHINLDRQKLKQSELSVTSVAQRLASTGQNVPAGNVNESNRQVAFKTLGEFQSLKQIETSIVSFYGNDIPVTVNKVGAVKDTLKDEKSRFYVNGQKSVSLYVFRQSGSNTVAVVDAVKQKVARVNEELAKSGGLGNISVVRDGSKPIRNNIDDVEESILVGVILTFLVVFFFLGNLRSTFITGLAVPYSLIGAFILISVAGFSINIMSLLALSLAVGLVIDDAIVVRENIFRHIEAGVKPQLAALIGTKEVSLAVIATTLTVMAVFGPVAFLSGVIGKFFKTFGLSVCFAMAISIFDAFTMAPMLSAYYAGKSEGRKGIVKRFEDFCARHFNRFQDSLQNGYDRLLKNFVIPHPGKTLLLAFGFAAISIGSLKWVPKDFLPPQDFGEFAIDFDLPPGSNLDAMTELGKKVDELVRAHSEVKQTTLTIGNRDGEANVAMLTVELVSARQRKVNTSQMKEILRNELKTYSFAHPKVRDIDIVGGAERPFNVNIVGTNLKQLEEVAQKLLEWLKTYPSLKDADLNYRPGKPEFQVQLEEQKAERLGISSMMIGQELRAQVEGVIPAKFRENGIEYDIRVRLEEDQRNLKNDFQKVYVPNINNSLVRLSQVSQPVESTGPSTINRQNRTRYIGISADLTPGGAGLGQTLKDVEKKINEMGLPPGVSYRFWGQAERFEELISGMIFAAGLALLLIYLIMATLYESFITPVTLMMVLPLAACGAFYALLITQKSLNIFSMIGCIMLLGVAMKNSILLVDYANQKLKEGMDRISAISEAGRVRLRPILMTTVALIAGMLPIALGLNEASRQRTSMGVAIIGGLITSTLLSLLVVPASFSYIDRFRAFLLARAKTFFHYEE